MSEPESVLRGPAAESALVVLGADRQATLDRLDWALSKYQSAIREQAYVEADLIEARRDAMLRAQGTNITARDREVEMATTDLRAELAKLKCEAAACQAQLTVELAKMGAQVRW